MNYSICIALLVLVFSTSFNQGQTIKFNERRAAGLVPYPRIGRYIAMARADGSAGLVNFPRVGRSGASISFSSSDPDRIRDFQSESRNYIDRDYKFIISKDFDHDGHYSDSEESRNRYDNSKNSMLIESRPSTSEKEQHRDLNRCNHRVNRPWALLLPAQDISNLHQKQIQNLIPRLVREVGHEPASNLIS